MTENDKPATSDDDILAEMRKRVAWSASFEDRTRTEGLDDLQFTWGDQWPDEWRSNRIVEHRPCLTSNKLPAYVHQIVNDIRQAKPAISVHPVDDNGDEEVAEILQGMIRHIEYASNADVAYDTATHNQVVMGFGYFRLVTDYCSDDSFDQEIRFKRVRNSFTVFCGPHSEPDGSDMEWCVITEEIPREEFVRQYPTADASAQLDLHVPTNTIGMSWLTRDTVRVAEYYRVECKTATLCMLADGSSKWKDELPLGAEIVKERKSEKRSVVWRKCSGVDILETVELPGPWIPVFPVYGDEADIDGKVMRSGIIRWAKDPQRMYNYWITAATEEVALRPKTPYIMAEGQEEGHELAWSQANQRSFSFLTYKPVSIDGTLAPAPQRQPMADMPTGVMMMAQHANDDIKATTGIFDASLGARGNETSGKAILARQREGDVGNFHFIDNLSRAIRHAGRVIIKWIPHYYDTQRVVRILGEDEKIEHATINQREQKLAVDPASGYPTVIERVLNDVTIGTYDVTVNMGPSYTTMRQEAADAMVSFGQSWPKLMDVAGDKVVKAMDWPGAEEIAERIKRTMPPELTQDEDEQQPIPPQVQQQLDQAGQYIQMLQADHEKLVAELKSKTADRDLEKYKADLSATTQIALEEMKLQMAPLADLGGRIAQIEAALGNIADHIVPAMQQMAQPMPQPQQMPQETQQPQQDYPQ